MILLDYASLSLIFSGVVAFSTIVYAALTWKLVSETRRMREVQTEPNISITIQPRVEWVNFIDFILQNVGLGPAYDISFSVEPDFEYSKGEFLSQLNFMKGLKYLAPNQKIQFFLTTLIEDTEQKLNNPFEIKVVYKNKLGKKYTETFTIDFSKLSGLSQLGENPLHSLADNIKGIKNELHLLATGFHKLKIIAYTKKDLEKENKAWLKRTRQNQAKTK